MGVKKTQIRERVKKVAMVMRAVWRIGMKLFGKDCERRIWLFDRLVWTVLSYGAEIWEWKERGLVKKIQERYLRWALGMEWRTPRYMMKEERQRDLLRTRAGKLAWSYEKKLKRKEGRGAG
ncbi:hypothetical protein QLX08_005508 [Tetragonisca angustula]|uniref:Uncharacterized protein n=1 Tax=Tetragonisca angustula TaxID=166442 RepID=A0AAW0ZY35_9HYME